jgi:hypothetical protein
VPYDVIYYSDSIKVIKSHGYAQKILDITSSKKTYLDKLSDIDEQNRLEFDYTARTLHELIRSPIKWGIDNSCRVFNLSSSEKFPIKTFKILKKDNNLLWLRGISYPFELSRHIKLDNIDANTILVDCVYVNNTWIIYEFVYTWRKETEISL